MSAFCHTQTIGGGGQSKRKIKHSSDTIPKRIGCPVAYRCRLNSLKGDEIYLRGLI
jgi:hypothetical protein